MAISLVRRTVGIGLVALALTTVSAAPGQAQRGAGTVIAHTVKAQFLLNFLHFIEWPPPLAGGSDPVRVCLVGGSPVGDSMRAYDGERVGGRPIVVEALKREEDARRCRLIFVPETQEVRLPVLVRQVGSHGVLLVTESSTALKNCASIALVVAEAHVRFDINLAALRHHGLVASSQLLHLARDRVDYPDRCRPS
jgi:hypothetical protein